MNDRRLHSLVAAEAVDWFVRNRGRELSAEERVAFGAWLKSSPLHIEEYLRTAAMAQNLRAAVASMSVDMDALIAAARAEGPEEAVVRLRDRAPHAPAPSSSRWRAKQGRLLLAACALAGAVIALAAALWMQRDGQRFGLPKEFETAHGEQRSWLLPDGSGLDLNSDSAVVVRYTRHERVVKVERGQALFQVMHESARRFRVIAGHIAVIAVGTEFDVLRNAGATVVTVVQGRVAVFTPETTPPPVTAHASLPARGLSLGAGQQVRIDTLLPRLQPPLIVAANVAQTVAWVQHQIAFDRQPLGEVAAQFSRYSSVPIVIQSERLRALPVSGMLNEYDTESFLAFIARLDGVQIDRRSDRITVSDKSR